MATSMEKEGHFVNHCLAMVGQTLLMRFCVQELRGQNSFDWAVGAGFGVGV